MARLPQAGALLGLCRPGEGPAAKFLGDLAESGRLFLHTVFRAVEFEEELRTLFQRCLRIEVDGAHLHLVDQFDPRHRYAGLDGDDHRLAGRRNARERTDAARNRLGNAVQRQRDLGNDAERAFRADHQPGQIVTGAGLPGAPRGLDDIAVGA